ncbi:helix-turn-helix domain-containing protein [Paludifilum halophilum]|uniref:Cytoskeleton protein RodZ-like C-terminal domain-containing protein n=1 Tax=Paludifilum halophilum TaxID=1642702 RepID=A0A235BB36_9BACL|nr:helix-turn-helix domain-containing protein [Paludifilum halophilum]OYD09514.1 hypothetical protein CHM34_00385 [Paludifilum halophilum]
MSKPTDRLRRTREKAGLTLEHVQEQTKIQVRFLQALEEARFHELPGKFYTRAFIRSYADYLGIDSTPVLRYYEEKLTEENLEEELSEADPPKPSISRRQRMEQRKKRGERRFSWIRFPRFSPLKGYAWLLLVLFVLLIPTVIYLFGAWDDDKLQGEEKSNDPGSSDSQTEKDQENEAEVQLIKPSETNKYGDEFEVKNAKEVVVTVEAEKQSWFRYRAGGPTQEVTEEAQLQPGQKKTFKHPAWISLLIGNPARVKLMVNGHVIDTSEENSQHAYQLKLKK